MAEAVTVRIPVIEGELETSPFPQVDDSCAWCHVRLGAIHATPRVHRGRWLHPDGCHKAAVLCW